MKLQTKIKNTEVCVLEAVSYGFSYAVKNAWGLAKANSIIVLMVLLVLSLVQVWQERTSPILKTYQFTPTMVYVDPRFENVENYCFKWEFEITRPSRLINFNWKLETSNGNYFVTPWAKDSGRFVGASTPQMFELAGYNIVHLCVSASATSETSERIYAKLTYESSIFGLPWTNSSILQTTFGK